MYVRYHLPVQSNVIQTAANNQQKLHRSACCSFVLRPGSKRVSIERLERGLRVEFFQKLSWENACREHLYLAKTPTIYVRKIYTLVHALQKVIDHWTAAVLDVPSASSMCIFFFLLFLGLLFFDTTSTSIWTHA